MAKFFAACLATSLVAGLLLGSSSPAFAQPNGVVVLDSLFSPHGISPQGTFFSSCWGWVSPDGKEYALLGTATGTSIIDLNVSPIQEIAFVPGNLSTYAYREIKTYKHYAYIVSEGGLGVQIVDLAGLPNSAVLVKNFNFVAMFQPDSGKNIDKSHTVTLADGYLYLNGSARWSPSGVLIFSLRNDPTNPEYLGSYEPTYVHDSYVRNDTLYAAAIYGVGLYVVDVRSKAFPVTMGLISYPGAGTHNVWATTDGKFALTCDEVNTTPHDLKIWALDSLPNSVKVAEWIAEPTSNIHNVYGRGNFAYVAHYTAGMWVVDVHDPRNPLPVGFHDTYAGASGGYAGCWGVYPYFPSGRWIGSDMQSGLYLCTFDRLQPRVRSSLLAPPDNSSFATPTAFRWQRAADQAEDPHHYALHLWGQGLDTMLAVADTSLVPPLDVLLPVSGSYAWSVLIEDEFTEVASVDTFHFSYTGTVGAAEPEPVPTSFELRQNFPNPFNPLTRIEFTLARASSATLQIVDLLGREVASLLRGELEAGPHEVAFDATSLPSGVYLYRLSTPSGVTVRKMTLLR